MANQEIAVNTETLALDIAELNTTLETARKMLGDMFTQIQELDAMWDGPRMTSSTSSLQTIMKTPKNYVRRWSH